MQGKKHQGFRSNQLHYQITSRKRIKDPFIRRVNEIKGRITISLD